MRLVLANPAGLWALMAIPLVLLIHFLQQQSRRVRTSTLFLLEHVKPESVGGARLERLRHSVPLWLQLFAAAILAWLLSEPRWIRQDSRQTVVVVLDSSVSMGAFKKETRALLADKLARWSGAAARTDWHLLESGARRPRLYAGADLAALLGAVEKWEPSQGTHAPDAALFIARGLVRVNAGIVIFVTDRKTETPSDVALMSAGAPIENTGFAGGDIRVGAGNQAPPAIWRALIRNYGRERQEREWWTEDESQPPPATRRKLIIEPGQTIALEGELPPNSDRVTLVLAPDKFARDDRLPLQKPRPRMVRAAVRLSGPSGDLLRKIFGVLDGVEMGSLTPDLLVDELGNAVDTHAVQLGGSVGENGTLDPAWVAAEDHRLTRELAWSGLLSGRPAELTLGEGDVPLLWKGPRPLALLRAGVTAEGKPIQRLILNWDLSQSNAARVPALPVMLQRFVEMVRERKREPWAGNFETAQHIEGSWFAPAKTDPGSEAGATSAPGLELRAHGERMAFAGRVPERPGYFEVLENGKIIISGAAQFADAREADFRDAEMLDTSEQRRIETALKQSEADPWMPLWVLALFACLLGSWAWRSCRKARSVSVGSNPAGSRPVRQLARGGRLA